MSDHADRDLKHRARMVAEAHSAPAGMDEERAAPQLEVRHAVLGV